MPMGPIELADTVGLDICLAVADKLAETLPVNVPERLRSMVEKGKLGRKSGSGFYNYTNGKIQKSSAASSFSAPFGTGFAPFLGGPIHHVQQKGKDAMLKHLKILQADADKGWDDVF